MKTSCGALLRNHGFDTPTATCACACLRQARFMQRQSGSVLDAYIASQANGGVSSAFGSNDPLAFNSSAAANFGREYGTLVRPHPQYHHVADTRSGYDTFVEFVGLTMHKQSCSCAAGLEASRITRVRQQRSTLPHGNKIREHLPQLKTPGRLHTLGRQCLAMAMIPWGHGNNSLPICSRLLQQSRMHSHGSR